MSPQLYPSIDKFSKQLQYPYDWVIYLYLPLIMINKCVVNFFNLVAIYIANGKAVEQNKKIYHIISNSDISCSYVLHSKNLLACFIFLAGFVSF